MKTYKRKHLLFTVLCIVVMLSGCTDQLAVLEAENAWTEALTQGEVDYKKFCDPAKQAIYSLRSEDMGEVLSVKDISLIKKALSYTDASAMETDMIVTAMMEDTFIITGITEAYSNAETINYAVKIYCDKCYENKKNVKVGKISMKLSPKADSGKIKYNGKVSDLKKFLNKYIHPEARNGYCLIEINDYNSPVSVLWSSDKIKTNKDDEITSSWNVIDISEVKSIIGKYPSTFWVSNTLTERTIAKTSLASSVESYQITIINSEDISALQNMLTEIYRSSIDNSINLDELGVEEANIEIINGIGNDFNSVKNSEHKVSMTIETANSNAKLAYTNAATWCTKCEISSNSVHDGWYFADLSKNSADNTQYDGSQNDFEKALCYYMSNISDYGYVCVYIKNQSPDKAYYSDKDILSNVDLNSMPEKVVCDSNNIIGSYPWESQLGDTANFSLIDRESMMAIENLAVTKTTIQENIVWEERLIENVRYQIIDHYTDLSRPMGELLSMKSDDYDSADEYKYTLRYSHSQDEVNEIINAGGIPSANAFVADITVNKQTGKVKFEGFGDDSAWYVNLIGLSSIEDSSIPTIIKPQFSVRDEIDSFWDYIHIAAREDASFSGEKWNLINMYAYITSSYSSTAYLDKNAVKKVCHNFFDGNGSIPELNYFSIDEASNGYSFHFGDPQALDVKYISYNENADGTVSVFCDVYAHFQSNTKNESEYGMIKKCEVILTPNKEYDGAEFTNRYNIKSVNRIASYNYAGSCGEDVMYAIDEDNVAYIYGNGKINDYNYTTASQIKTNSPFSGYDMYGISISKVVIEEGVTYIGKGAFPTDCNVDEFYIPKSVTAISDEAFADGAIRNNKKVEITIYCYADSYALAYAKTNGINYVMDE